MATVPGMAPPWRRSGAGGYSGARSGRAGDPEELTGELLTGAGLDLPGGQEGLGDTAELLDVLAVVDGARVHLHREPAVEGEDVGHAGFQIK